MTQILVSALVVGANLLAGLILLYRSRRFVRNAMAATGTVAGLKRRGTSKSGRPLYSPVVHFVAADGSRVEFTESIRRHPAGFEVGQQVEVLYDRRNFQRARAIKSRWDLYFPAWIFLLVGGALLLVGALLALVFVVLTLLLGPPKTP